jgi:hypothetical protein
MVDMQPEVSEPLSLYSTQRGDLDPDYEQYGAYNYSKSCQVYDGVMLTVSALHFYNTLPTGGQEHYYGRLARAARWSDTGTPDLGPEFAEYLPNGSPEDSPGLENEVQWLARLKDGIAIEFFVDYEGSDVIAVGQVWYVDENDLHVTRGGTLTIQLPGQWEQINNNWVVTAEDNRVVAITGMRRGSDGYQAYVMLQVIHDDPGGVVHYQHVLYGPARGFPATPWYIRNRTGAIVLHDGYLYRIGAAPEAQYNSANQWPFEVARYDLPNAWTAPTNEIQLVLWDSSMPESPVDDGVMWSGEGYATLVGNSIDIVVPCSYSNQYNPYWVQRFDIATSTLGTMRRGDLFWDEYYGGAEVYVPIVVVDENMSMIGSVGGDDTSREESASHGVPVRTFNGDALSSPVPGMGSWVPNLYHYTGPGSVDYLTNFILVNVGSGRVMAALSNSRWSDISPAQDGQVFISQIGGAPPTEITAEPGAERRRFFG